MVIRSEQLLETLLDLERSRQREREIRLEAEALLEGLRGITGAHERHELFRSLLLALRTVIDFEEAFILQSADDGKLCVLATTLDALHDTVWELGSVFRRALSGRPVASFDIAQVPEWKQQPSGVTHGIVSALHIGLHGGGWEAILVVTHSQPKYFGPSHVKKAMRFSPLAAQALLTLELRRAVTERDRFFQLSLDAMAIFDSRGGITQQNQGWTDTFGQEELDARQKNIFNFLHPDDGEKFRAAIDELRQQEGKSLITSRFRDKNGNHRWFSCGIALYQDELLYYIVARDITDRVLFEQQLAHQAGHDSLTGLKNRAQFMESLRHVFRKSSPGNGSFFALFFLDLNKFKEINDTLGHEIGDELLKSFANTLKEIVREGDLVARLGGDEFTIILHNVHAIADVERIADRIHEKCLTPYLLKGHQVQASASIGIALSSTYHENEEALLHAADLAMYKAKLNKKLKYCIW